MKRVVECVGRRETEVVTTRLTAKSLRRTCGLPCCCKQSWLLDPVISDYKGVWRLRGVLQGEAWHSLCWVWITLEKRMHSFSQSELPWHGSREWHLKVSRAGTVLASLEPSAYLFHTWDPSEAYEQCQVTSKEVGLNSLQWAPQKSHKISTTTMSRNEGLDLPQVEEHFLGLRAELFWGTHVGVSL